MPPSPVEKQAVNVRLNHFLIIQEFQQHGLIIDYWFIHYLRIPEVWINFSSSRKEVKGNQQSFHWLGSGALSFGLLIIRKFQQHGWIID